MKKIHFGKMMDKFVLSPITNNERQEILVQENVNTGSQEVEE
jgi:hypothetical protein